MTNGHGGARPGSGRKPRSERYLPQVAAADDALADHLQRAVANLLALADGGIETVEERWEPAGLVLVDVLHVDDDGKATKGKRTAFPDLDPEQLVLVERKVSRTLPDRHSNIYIVDRIMGRPVPAAEGDADGQGPREIVVRRVDRGLVPPASESGSDQD